MLVPCGAIIKGVSEIIAKDKSFHTTHKSETILRAAERFLEWATPPYSDEFVKFSSNLLLHLQSCITNKKSIQAEREHICTYYHVYRTSPAFHTAWNTFLLHSIHTNPGAIFYQSITYNILNHLMSQRYPSGGNPAKSIPTVEQLNNIEENALRYVAGYVCKKITSQLMKPKHKENLALLIFMSETNGVEVNSEDHTESWTNILDRGGLYHVSDATHHFFYQIEVQLRKFFNLKTAVLKCYSKATIVNQISRNAEVVHQWQDLTEDHEDLVIVDELYKTFINEFVTIRGFAFATSIVETYKEISAKNLQKTKGLRKTLPI